MNTVLLGKTKIQYYTTAKILPQEYLAIHLLPSQYHKSKR
jgi:hypothetical protein